MRIFETTSFTKKVKRLDVKIYEALKERMTLFVSEAAFINNLLKDMNAAQGAVIPNNKDVIRERPLSRIIRFSTTTNSLAIKNISEALTSRATGGSCTNHEVPIRSGSSTSIRTTICTGSRKVSNAKND